MDLLVQSVTRPKALPTLEPDRVGKVIQGAVPCAITVSSAVSHLPRSTATSLRVRSARPVAVVTADRRVPRLSRVQEFLHSATVAIAATIFVSTVRSLKIPLSYSTSSRHAGKLGRCSRSSNIFRSVLMRRESGPSDVRDQPPRGKHEVCVWRRRVSCRPRCGSSRARGRTRPSALGSARSRRTPSSAVR